MSDVTVSNHEDAHQYEAWIDGELAGRAEYELDGDVVVFTHTVVDDAFEGRGVGSALARGALDDVAAGPRQVRPLCPFIKGWIEKHPDYQHLVEG